MRNRFPAIVGLFLFLPSFASAPGQLLDCTDWTVVEPGHTCAKILDCGSASPSDCDDLGARGAHDNEGRLLRVRETIVGSCGSLALYQHDLLGLRGAAWELITRSTDRCNAGKTEYLLPGGVSFDDKNGRLVLDMLSVRCDSEDCSLFSQDSWIASFDGFATTFDVLQTFTPQASLGFRVPYMPEGFGGVDWFDTFYGSLSRPIDFGQSTAIRCHYPDAPPPVGTFLEVADTVPDPAPGSGYYYITAASYTGQVRYGRQRRLGVESGRNPALLPACNP